MRSGQVVQGLIATLTGGFYFDPRHPDWVNLTHIYSFIILLLFPFCLSLISSQHLAHTGYIVYVVLIGVTFTTVKITNWCLHRVYDSGECEQEPDAEDDAQRPEEHDEIQQAIEGGDCSVKKADDEQLSRILKESIEGGTTSQHESTALLESEGPNKPTDEFHGIISDIEVSQENDRGSRNEQMSEVTGIKETSEETALVESESKTHKIDVISKTSSKNSLESKPKSRSHSNIVSPSIVDFAVVVHHRNSSCSSIERKSSSSSNLDHITPIDSVSSENKEGDNELNTTESSRKETADDSPSPTPTDTKSISQADSVQKSPVVVVKTCEVTIETHAPPPLQEDDDYTRDKPQHSAAKSTGDSIAQETNVSGLKSVDIGSDKVSSRCATIYANDPDSISDAQEGTSEIFLRNVSTSTPKSPSNVRRAKSEIETINMRRHRHAAGGSSGRHRRRKNYSQSVIHETVGSARSGPLAIPHTSHSSSAIRPLMTRNGKVRTDSASSSSSTVILDSPTNVLHNFRPPSTSSREDIETSLDFSIQNAFIPSPAGGSLFTDTPFSNFLRSRGSLATHHGMGLPSQHNFSANHPQHPLHSIHNTLLSSHLDPTSHHRFDINQLSSPSSAFYLSSSSAAHQFQHHLDSLHPLLYLSRHQHHHVIRRSSRIGYQNQAIEMMRFNDSTHIHSIASPNQPEKPRFYYKLWLLPGKKFIKLRFDRLALLTLLDRNLSLFELLVSISLAVAVSFSAVALLSARLFYDIPLFILCLVIASCHYTLLKSVQPDAASPTHGYNRVIIYSRPIYFCILTAILLTCRNFLDENSANSSQTISGVTNNDDTASSNAESGSTTNLQLFGLQIINPFFVKVIYDTVWYLLILFPLLFCMGLLPQITTLLTYLIEQLDIHFFGGAATTVGGLPAAALSLGRSLISVTLLFWMLTVSYQPNLSDSRETVLFSIFCGLLVSLAYLQSRAANNCLLYWNLIKTSFQNYARSKNEKTKKIIREKQQTRKDTIDSHTEDSQRPAVPKVTVQHGERIIQDLRSASQIDETLSRLTAKQDEDSDEENTNQNDNTASSQVKKKSETIEVDKDVQSEAGSEPEVVDPLPSQLNSTLATRLESDMIICVFITIVVFAIHVSTIFRLQPYVGRVLTVFAVVIGFLLHYLLKQVRKELPWLCFVKPILKSHEHGMFEVKRAARLMWFERLEVLLWFIDRNVIYPLVFLSAITTDTSPIVEKFGQTTGILLVATCAFKAIRSSYCDSSHNYLVLIFTHLFFDYDLSKYSESFLINYFFMTIVYSKFSEFMLKMQFVITYVAPWQITWGSAFHAFAQPFSVPHSGMLFLQAVLSSIFSAPLQPVLGSAIFFASYVRPVKFWERDYNTKRTDTTNMRLAYQLERNPLGGDDNNFNSIFYEHLTRSLQKSLYGDIILGRWGQVASGDCFILAGDNLNCLVHIIELGNGLVTFQLRGLEFRGTYCQQREVEAITEDVSDDEGCCCCEPGHLPGLLSLNAAFNQRWLAWNVTHSKYVVEGYSISDNSATTMLAPYELRKALISYYVKCIIFYAITSSKLSKWTSGHYEGIRDALNAVSEASFVDLDPTFNMNSDEDYDFRSSGMTRASFCHTYREWMKYCCSRVAANKSPILYDDSTSNITTNTQNSPYDENVASLCFALSLMGRRALSAASHQNHCHASVELLLYGLHSLFKGDFRITCARDEWVFSDMDLLKKVVSPAVRMALKLQQDHFLASDEYDDNFILYECITRYKQDLVISYEGDPQWRNSILCSAPSLLALRHVFDDGTDQYKVIMLNKRHISFRLIKINRECVRGLWAGQQVELVYLRNRNPERGSIQNAKQALRNIINSSCDQPIGYPIYVSPLLTSFVETSKPVCMLTGKPLSLSLFANVVLRFWNRIILRCSEGCSSEAGNRRRYASESGTAACAFEMKEQVHVKSRHNTRESRSSELSESDLYYRQVQARNSSRVANRSLESRLTGSGLVPPPHMASGTSAGGASGSKSRKSSLPHSGAGTVSLSSFRPIYSPSIAEAAELRSLNRSLTRGSALPPSIPIPERVLLGAMAASTSASGVISEKDKEHKEQSAPLLPSTSSLPSSQRVTTSVSGTAQTCEPSELV